MTKTRLSPHDRYIRSIMSGPEVAREFFENYLPQEIVDSIDFSSLEAQKDSFVDDKLRLQVADLLYTVNIHGEVGYIYLLLEHASTPDKFLPYRMLKYTIGIFEQHLKKTEETKLPFVYPLILYTGAKPFAYSTDFFDLFGKDKELAQSVFLKPVQLIDLGKASDEALQNFFWFGAAALVAKHIHDADILPIFKSVLELLRGIEKKGNLDYTYVTLSYVVEAGEVKDKDAFIEAVKSNLSEIDEEKVMTLAEQWRQEGYQKGIEKGIEKGLEKGKKEEKTEIAMNLLMTGMGKETVASVTGLSLEELKKFYS